MLFSFLSTVTLVVYPVIGSYHAFESYSKVANRIAATNFKVGGISVPIGVLFKSQDISTSDDEQLQLHLIAIQKWFIYWIVFASLQLVESLLFLKYLVPFYFAIKVVVSMWLVFPMINGVRKSDTSRSFDTTQDWLEFTNSGAGFVFFTYIKPIIEDGLTKVDLGPIKNAVETGLGVFSSNPLVSNFILSRLKSSDASSSGTATLSLPGQESVIENSYVIVKSLKNRFYGNGDSTKEVPIEEFDEVNVQDQVDSQKDITTETNPPSHTTKPKGWLW
jgi:hypothetical protein